MNGRRLAICGMVTTPISLCTGLCFAAGSSLQNKRFPDPDAFEPHLIMLSLQGLYCTFFGC
jgi:hypothetical protein